jgi:hypothetical protein
VDLSVRRLTDFRKRALAGGEFCQVRTAVLRGLLALTKRRAQRRAGLFQAAGRSSFI